MYLKHILQIRAITYHHICDWELARNNHIYFGSYGAELPTHLRRSWLARLEMEMEMERAMTLPLHRVAFSMRSLPTLLTEDQQAPGLEMEMEMERAMTLPLHRVAFSMRSPQALLTEDQQAPGLEMEMASKASSLPCLPRRRASSLTI